MKSLKPFSKINTPTTMTKSKDFDSENDLDIIEPQELNKMNLLAIECFNYGKREHFACNYKSSSKIDKHVNFANKGK